ncbi:MAG: LuxR C-terminal-related transcriptional regulator [Parasphingorhabdus sp.]
MTIALAPPLDAEIGAQLVEAVGTDDFGRLLLSIAGDIAHVDELFGYIVVDGKEPRSIISNSLLAGADERVKSYMHHFYRHDPAVQHMGKIKKGHSFVQRIGLKDIIPYDYREHCFAKPGFSEKLSFGWRGAGYLLVLSFYRIESSDQEVLGKLASLANLTLAIMVKRHAPIDKQSFVDTMERRLQRSFAALTQRERQVCARSIAGHSAKKIGLELGLSAGSVLTYRQRAYQRFDFNRASDFLPALID